MNPQTMSMGQTIKVLALAALSVLLLDFVFSGVKRALGSSTNDFSNVAYLTILYFCVGAFTAGYVYKSVAGIQTLLGILTGGFVLLAILRLVLVSLLLQKYVAGMEPEDVAMAVFKGALFAGFAMGAALWIFVLLFRTTEARMGFAYTSDPAKVRSEKGEHTSSMATCSNCGERTESETGGFFGRRAQMWCRRCSAFIGGNPLAVLTAGVALMVFCGFASIGAAGMIGTGPSRPTTGMTFLFLLIGFGHGLRLVFDGFRGYAKNAALSQARPITAYRSASGSEHPTVASISSDTRARIGNLVVADGPASSSDASDNTETGPINQRFASSSNLRKAIWRYTAAGVAGFAVATLLFAFAAFAPERKGISRASSMSFRVFWPCSGNADFCAPRIIAQGELTSDTPALFEAFLNAPDKHEHPLPPRATIVFDSVGGNLTAAMALGRKIRAAGINTEVAPTYDRAVSVMEQETFVTAATCASACVLAFAGGVVRTVAGDKVIGVHQFSGAKEDVGESAAQVAVVVLSDYLREMGVDRGILDRASLVEPRKIQFVTIADATALQLDNTASRQSPWTLRAGSGGELAGTSDRTTPQYGTTTSLALFKKEGKIGLAIGLSFSESTPRKLADAQDELNGRALLLTPHGGTAVTIDDPRWILSGNHVRTIVTLNAEAVASIKNASSLVVDTECGHAGRHLCPSGKFELASLRPLLPALLK